MVRNICISQNKLKKNVVKKKKKWSDQNKILPFYSDLFSLYVMVMTFCVIWNMTFGSLGKKKDDYFRAFFHTFLNDKK